MANQASQKAAKNGDYSLISFPHSKECEQAILGSMIQTPGHIPAVLQKLGRDDFFSSAHRLIFDAILNLHESGKSVDAQVILESMDAETREKAGGMAYLAEVLYGLPEFTQKMLSEYVA